MQRPVSRKSKIHDDLKLEYVIIKYPHMLQNKGKEMYDHLNLVHISQTRYDWIHDYKIVISK